MDLSWIALFGLLCAGIFGLLAACDRWLALTPPASSASSAIKGLGVRPGSDANRSTT